jgi:hypothetical protein
MQDLIGQQLRQLYDSVLVEPIPDRIVELLMKLDEVSPSQGDQTAPSADGDGADGHDASRQDAADGPAGTAHDATAGTDTNRTGMARSGGQGPDNPTERK